MYSARRLFVLGFRRYHDFAKFSEENIWAALQGPLVSTDYVNAMFYLNRNAGVTFASGRLDSCFESIMGTMADIDGNDLVRLFAVSIYGRPKERFWYEMCKHALNCSTFTPANLAHILHNLAHIENPKFDFSRKQPRVKMGEQEESLIRKVSTEALEKTHLFTGKDIVTVLTALVQLGVEDETETLIKQLCVEARVMAPELGTEQIAITLKLLALLELYDEALVEALCSEVAKKTRTFNVPQTILVFESLLTFGVYHQEMVGRLFMSLSIHCNQFTPPTVVKALRAMYEFDMYNNHIVKQILKGANAVATRFTAAEIAETFRLLTELGHFNMLLGKRLTAEAGLKAAHFNPNELAIVISTMSKFGLVDEHVLRRLFGKASEKIRDFTSTQIADLLTALSVLPVRDEVLARQLCDQGLTLTNNFSPTDADKVVTAIARIERLAETKSVLNSLVVKEKPTK